MKVVRGLVQYYINLMMKLGLIRFSLLLASALVVLAMIVEMAVTILLQVEVQSIDLVHSIFFGLIITPWAIYFISIMSKQLDQSRQRLSRMVNKLEVMKKRDDELNMQLKENIKQLNQEMNRREQIQVEFEQQSILLRSFLDASPDLVYYRNENNEFSGCNRAMELLTGKSEKQLIGLTPADIYEEKIATKVIETDEKIFRHNVSLTYEQWLVYPDERKCCFELRKVPFYDRVGKRHGIMGFGRDITERKRYQEALERASKDKTTFISTISHELRTPLNGIVGLSRILLDTKLSAEQTNYLKTIHLSAITLGNIFNDVIEMDKIERRKIQIDNQPVNLTEFISDLENLTGLLVQPKGLNFVMDTQADLPISVVTDGTRLRQILWNLIGNAVKFTPKGDIKLSIWRENTDKLFFQVQDSGMGIPDVELDKIFAMYYQVKDSDGGSMATGTGIGLAVSRRLAQAMGGDIQVTSSIGKGSIFTLSIIAPRIESTIDEQHNDYPLPVLNILLVEDIELNVIVARSVLEKLGHTVDVAMNGKDALSMFTPDEYDLVLLDIQLPDMTGLDIARKLHQQFDDHVLPPLIALTANVLKDKREYFNAGIDDVLNKPLSIEQLSRVIARYWGDGTISSAVVTEVTTEINENNKLYETKLDTEMLQQYIELVGFKLIDDSLLVFEKMLPEYLAILDSNMIAKDQNGIVDEGHKIKGAAASVGLKHLQQLAQQIQSPELPAWWDNVQEWIDELKQDWKSDIEILRHWVDVQRTKK